MCAVLGTAAELERETIYYRLKSGRDKYVRDGGRLGKPKGVGVKSKDKLAVEYKGVIKNLKSGQSVRNTAKITGVSQSTVQRVKKEKDIQYPEYEYELDYCWDCAYDPEEDDEFQGRTDYKPWIYGRK